MIRHKCGLCGTDLVSPEGLAGGTRACPSCKELNGVPDGGRQAPGPGVVPPSEQGPEIICPNANCGYSGPSNLQPRDISVMLVLLVLFLPGDICLIWWVGSWTLVFTLPVTLFVLMFLLAMVGSKHIVCPKCGLGIPMHQ